MANDLMLEGEGGSVLVEIAVNEYGWSPCFLLVDGRCIFLGADEFAQVTAGLLRAVSSGGDTEEAGQIGKHVVSLALMLSEAHYCLYFADSGPDRLLFWQKARQEPVKVEATLRLSPQQRRQWQDQLTTALQEYSRSRSHQTAEVTAVS